MTCNNCPALPFLPGYGTRFRLDLLDSLSFYVPCYDFISVPAVLYEVILHFKCLSFLNSTKLPLLSST